MANVPVPAGLDPKAAHIVSAWQHTAPIVTCRFDPQQRFVVCGTQESAAQRFRIADGAKTPLLGAHESWVFAVAFSPDGNMTLTGGGEGKIGWWETAAESPAPIRAIAAHQGWIRALCVSPDGSILASGGNDAVVRLWNLADGALIREMPGHQKNIYSLCMHPDGKSLFSGDLAGVIKRWDLANGQEMGSYDAKALYSFNGGQLVDFGGVRSLAVSPDQQFLAAGGLHKSSNPLGAVHEPLVQLFNLQSRELVRSQIAEGLTQGVIWRLVYLADGTLMGASGGGSGGWLVFWKPDADKDVHRFQLPNIVRELDLAPDGLSIATAHHDAHLRITRLAV